VQIPVFINPVDGLINAFVGVGLFVVAVEVQFPVSNPVKSTLTVISAGRVAK